MLTESCHRCRCRLLDRLCRAATNGDLRLQKINRGSAKRRRHWEVICAEGGMGDRRKGSEERCWRCWQGLDVYLNLAVLSQLLHTHLWAAGERTHAGLCIAAVVTAAMRKKLTYRSGRQNLIYCCRGCDRDRKWGENREGCRGCYRDRKWGENREGMHVDTASGEGKQRGGGTFTQLKMLSMSSLVIQEPQAGPCCAVAMPAAMRALHFSLGLTRPKTNTRRCKTISPVRAGFSTTSCQNALVPKSSHCEKSW